MTLFENEQLDEIKQIVLDLKNRVEKLEGRKLKSEESEKMPFESFWNKYDKKVDRVKCEKLWNKLCITDQKLTLRHLDYYIPQTEKQFRKNPQTYLNGQCWNDEIIMEEKDTQKFTYFEMLDKNKENGKKGGRPRKTQNNPDKPNGFLENPSKPKKPDTDNDTDTEIDKEIDKRDYKESYREWLDFRKEMKLKKLTITGVKKQLKFLDKQPDQIACIEQSIRNSYQGLFEVKNGTNKQNNKPESITQIREFTDQDERDDGFAYADELS